MDLTKIGSIEQTEKPKKEWKLVPNGKFTGKLVHVEQKLSKAGNEMLVCRFVVDVHGTEMSVTQRFMLSGTTSKALTFNKNKMIRMAKVLGFKEELTSTDQIKGLIDRKCTVEVVTKDSSNPAYGPNNEIKNFTYL